MTIQKWLSKSIKLLILLCITIQIVSGLETQYLNFSNNYSNCPYGTGYWTTPENSFDGNNENYAEYDVSAYSICSANVIGKVTIDELHPQNNQNVNLRYKRVWSGGTYAHLHTFYIYNWTSEEYVLIKTLTGLGGATIQSYTFTWSDDYLYANKNISIKFQADVGDTSAHSMKIYETYIDWEPVNNSCSSPSTGDWTIINGDTCNLTRDDIITGNLNISNGSLEIKTANSLTMNGEIWIYPGSNLTILSGGQING